MKGAVPRSTFWERFWKGIAEFAERKGGVQRQAAATGQVRSEPAKGATAEEFIRRIKQLSATRSNLQVGALHIINLERLKVHFGSEWKAMSSKVDTIARRVIEQKLGPFDLYSGFPGPTYLLVFGNLPSESAKFKCALIAAEIERRFLGEHDSTKGLTVRAAVMEIGHNWKIDEIEPQQLLARFIQQSSLPQASDDLTRQDPTAHAVASGDNAAEEPGWQTNGSSDQEPKTYHWKPLEQAYEDVDLPEIKFVYRPIWHVRREVLSSYHCTPVLADPVHGLLLGQSLALDPSAGTSLDRLVLARIVQDARIALERGQRGFISFPIYFQTLADQRRRQKVQDLLQSLHDYRSKLICEIIDIPAGTPGQRLYDGVAAIIPYVKVVNMRTSLARPDFSSLVGLRLHAVGIEATVSRAREESFMRAAERFVEAADRIGLRTYVHGLDTLSSVTASIAAGFNFVDGNAIASLVDHPDAIYHYDTQDLYGPLLKQH